MIPDDDTPAPADPPCVLCGAAAEVWLDELPGVIDGSTFRAFECSVCTHVFVWPSPVGDDRLGDAIRRHLAELPGFERYERHARLVASSSDPLDRLAQEEDVYWAVREVLRQNPGSDEWRILEIGSGLGHTVAALCSAGFDCTGSDPSPTTVATATERFGPWYVQLDVLDAPSDELGTFDLVIALGLVAQHDDPVALTTAAAAYLRPDGHLLITTPNRDAHVPGARWETALPPIDVAWFSERSVGELADRCGLDESLLDFEEFNRTHAQSVPANVREPDPTPWFDADFRPLVQAGWRARTGRALGRLPGVGRAARQAYEQARPGRVPLVHRSASLATTLTRRPADGPAAPSWVLDTLDR